MATLIETEGMPCSFELTREVQEKMAHAADPHALIPEESVRDLEPMDLSGRPYLLVKRLADMLISLAGIAILLVPSLVITAVLYADDPGQILFGQYRVGRDGKRFKMYKFRTMRMDTPKYMPTMEMTAPDQYITRFGRFLRRTSLDELPQLINVLRGDMSLVGPRPLISDEYEIHQMRMRFGVYAIRPGVTGLAQINGRDTVSPAEKVRWDVKYLQQIGPMTDLKILLGTLPKFSGDKGVVEGYNAAGEMNEENLDSEV